jgi:hypothetical protein
MYNHAVLILLAGGVHEAERRGGSAWIRVGGISHTAPIV